MLKSLFLENFKFCNQKKFFFEYANSMLITPRVVELPSKLEYPYLKDNYRSHFSTNFFRDGR